MKDYFEIYHSEYTVIRVEGEHFSFSEKAELLDKIDDPTLGSIWQKKTYENLYKLSVDMPDEDLFREICRLAHAADIQETETNCESESYDDDAYSEEITISFRGKTARIYWSPAALEILESAIHIGFAYALEEF